MADEILIIALNFSDVDRDILIPLDHSGEWTDILESKFKNTNHPYSISVTDHAIGHSVSIPSNFGRILRLNT